MDTPASQVSSDLLVPLASLNNTAAGSTTGSARDLASRTNKKHSMLPPPGPPFLQAPPTQQNEGTLSSSSSDIRWIDKEGEMPTCSRRPLLISI